MLLFNIEGVLRYRQGMITVIENMGQISGGIWSDKEMFPFRATVDEFENIKPIISVIQRPVKINRVWIEREIQRG